MADDAAGCGARWTDGRASGSRRGDGQRAPGCLACVAGAVERPRRPPAFRKVAAPRRRHTASVSRDPGPDPRDERISGLSGGGCLGLGGVGGAPVVVGAGAPPTWARRRPRRRRVARPGLHAHPEAMEAVLPAAVASTERHPRGVGGRAAPASSLTVVDTHDLCAHHAGPGRRSGTPTARAALLPGFRGDRRRGHVPAGLPEGRRHRQGHVHHHLYLAGTRAAPPHIHREGASSAAAWCTPASSASRSGSATASTPSPPGTSATG